MHPDFSSVWPSGTLPPFSVLRPAQQRVPYVFNSPHSGSHYPATFRSASRLPAQNLRRSEDVAVDALFSTVVEIGAPMLIAHFPRAWLDVNREPLELDPKLIADPLPAHANTRSPRVAGGLGTVPRLVAERTPIYDGKIPLAEVMGRIDEIYRPYHDRLAGLMAQTIARFGLGVLVDCHSMPSKGPKGDDGNETRHDIVVGDRYGTSCNAAITREILTRFAEKGYSVARNKPYAGGFITAHYGRPAKGLHAVQIEINRALYLDEETLEPNGHFHMLAADIADVMNHLVSLPETDLQPYAMLTDLAAE